MNILRDELVKKGNQYELIIHLYNSRMEFSRELGSLEREEDIKSDILSYVKRKYPNVRINAVKLMVGGMLITTFTLGQTGGAFAAPKDIQSSSEYARSAIERLVDQNVIVGDDKGNFNPKATMDRDAFTTMLVKAMDLEMVTPETPTFNDVAKDNWAYPFIETAVANGLISGMGEGSFAPKNHITREQMATILVRSLGLTPDDIRGMGDALTFADKEDISSYALDAVGFAVANNLFKGDDQNRFLGKHTATREQVAVVIDKYLTTRDALEETAAQLKSTTFTASAVPDDLNTIRLVFSKSVAALAAADISIVGADGSTITVTDIDLNDDQKTAVLTTGTMIAGTSYTITIDSDTIKGQSAITPTVVVKDLAVDDVTAIDAQNILVKFNRPVTSGNGTNGAENIANYTVTPAVSVISARLNDDRSSVLLTLDTAMTNETAYTIRVGKDIKDTDGKVLSTLTDYTTYIFFSDHTAPTVLDMSSTEVGSIKIGFSERLSSKPDVIILNGQTVDPSNILFMAGSDFVTILKDGIPGNIELGKSYPIYISGAKDLIGNTMDLFQGTVNYSIIAEAPDVDSITAIDENTLEIVFTEELLGADKLGGNNAALMGLVVKKNNIPLEQVTATSVDGKIFRIHLPKSDNVLYDATKNETAVPLLVSVDNYKDLANHVGNPVTQTVTVTKDTVGPALLDAAYSFSDGEFIFTFDEGLAALTDTTALAAGITLINNTTGVRTDLSEASIKPIASGDTKLIIKNTGDGGLGLAAGFYTFSFAQGLVKDMALNDGNTNTAFQTSVTIPSGAADLAKPVVLSIASPAKDTITVTFNEAVKGGLVSGSATDPDNYKLNGAALPANTMITLNTEKNIATITMPSGSIDNTETKILSIADVQDLAGNQIDPANKTVYLTDSTSPILEAAVYDSTTGAVVLSFSEQVHGANVTSPVAGDFVVKVNGVTVPDIVVAPGTENHQIRITSPSTNFSTGNITVTTAAAPTGADAAGNALAAGITASITR
ncbi:MAG: S-layer homology domain-containing protein [Bacillota bacterium]